MASGRPAFGSRFNTGNMEGALLARGFHYGTAPNSVVIAWNGGHAAVTLPDGTPVSSGESGTGVRIGGGGAYQPQFSRHMYLPVQAQEMNTETTADQPAVDAPPADQPPVDAAPLGDPIGDPAVLPPADPALAPAPEAVIDGAAVIPPDTALDAPAPPQAPAPELAPAPAADQAPPTEPVPAVDQAPPAEPAPVAEELLTVPA